MDGDVASVALSAINVCLESEAMSFVATST